MSDRHLPHWPRNVPHAITLPATSLYYNLVVSALRYPAKPAVIFYDTHIPYREFHETVDKLAGYLQQACGVKRGDRRDVAGAACDVAPRPLGGGRCSAKINRTGP